MYSHIRLRQQVKGLNPRYTTEGVDSADSVHQMSRVAPKNEAVQRLVGKIGNRDKASIALYLCL